MPTNNPNPQISDELLSAYLDGELSASEQASVEARLAVDAAAREMVEELKAVSLAVRELPRQGADTNLQDAILRRIRQPPQVSPRIKGEAGPEEKLTLGRSKRGWIWAAAAIAAALFVMAYQGQFGPEGRIREVAQQSDKSVPSQPEPEFKETPSFVNAPAPVAQGGGGGDVADFAFSEPVSEASSIVPRSSRRSESRLERSAETKPIVVQLTMPVESRRNRVLENVLAGQQIVAEAGIEISSIENISIEVVRVEASQQAIFSCLSTIESDAKNFLNVEVQEPYQESLVADGFASPWQQFNRGGPASGQKISQQQRAVAIGMQNDVQGPTSNLRQLQKRKSHLPDRNSLGANEEWQQVTFVIRSEPPMAPSPSKKASAN